MSSLTADYYFWYSGGVSSCFEGVPGYYGMFQDVPGLFRGVPDVLGMFRGCSGFYRHPKETSVLDNNVKRGQLGTVLVAQTCLCNCEDRK